MGKLDTQTNKNSSSFKKLDGAAGAVGKALAVTTTVALALATAITAVVTSSAKGEREMGNLANTAGTTKDEFEQLSFAFSTMQIDAKGTADAMSDVKERLGEFAAAGSGPFQDFADVVGLSKEEARALADEMQYLSGPDAVQQMVNMMDDANTSTAEMSFVMKSMSNDLEYASKLFQDNGKELSSLESMYKSATEQMKLSAGEIEDLQEAATSFDLMNASISKSASLVSAQLAPILNDFFGSVIETVPTATQTIVNFINSFKTPDEITNLISVQDQLTEATAELEEKTALLAKTSKGLGEADNNRSRNALTRMYSEQSKAVKELTDRVAALKEQEDKLNEVKVEDAETFDASGISADGSGQNLNLGLGTGDEIAAIEDRFKTEKELLKEKLEEELILIGENNELKEQLQQEYRDNILAIDDQAAADYAKLLEDEASAEEAAARVKAQATDDKIALAESYVSAAAAANTPAI